MRTQLVCMLYKNVTRTRSNAADTTGIVLTAVMKTGMERILKRSSDDIQDQKSFGNVVHVPECRLQVEIPCKMGNIRTHVPMLQDVLCLKQEQRDRLRY